MQKTHTYFRREDTFEKENCRTYSPTMSWRNRLLGKPDRHVCILQRRKRARYLSDIELITTLLKEAEHNVMRVLKVLLEQRIVLNGKNQGFYHVRILSYQYEVRITREGSICIINSYSSQTDPSPLTETKKEPAEEYGRLLHTQ